MSEEYEAKLNALKIIAIVEDIDIDHCGDDIKCIEKTIERVRQYRRGPTLDR